MQTPYVSEWAMGEGVEMALVPTEFYTVTWYLASKELEFYVDLAVVLYSCSCALSGKRCLLFVFCSCGC